MPKFMLLSRCENVWPFLTLRALTTIQHRIITVLVSICQTPRGGSTFEPSLLAFISARGSYSRIKILTLMINLK